MDRMNGSYKKTKRSTERVGDFRKLGLVFTSMIFGVVCAALASQSHYILFGGLAISTIATLIVAILFVIPGDSDPEREWMTREPQEEYPVGSPDVPLPVCSHYHASHDDEINHQRQYSAEDTEPYNPVPRTGEKSRVKEKDSVVHPESHPISDASNDAPAKSSIVYDQRTDALDLTEETEQFAPITESTTLQRHPFDQSPSDGNNDDMVIVSYEDSYVSLRKEDNHFEEGQYLEDDTEADSETYPEDMKGELHEVGANVSIGDDEEEMAPEKGTIDPAARLARSE